MTFILAGEADGFGFTTYEDWHRLMVALALTLMFWGLTRNFFDRWDVVSPRVGRAQYAHYVVGVIIFVISTLWNWGKGIDLQWPNFLFLAWCLSGIYTSWLKEPSEDQR